MYLYKIFIMYMYYLLKAFVLFTGVVERFGESFVWLIDFGFEASSHLTSASFAQLKLGLELLFLLLYLPRIEITHVSKI